MGNHRLITIKFSHYNEKARWALDLHRVPYVEEGYLPMFHMAPVALRTARHGFGKADRISTRLSTPVLLTDEGKIFSDSSAIVRYVSDRFASNHGSLYFDPEVAELERHFGDRLGPHTRRFGYYYAFREREMLPRLASANVGPLQAGLFRLAFPVLPPIMRRALGIDKEAADRSLRIIREELAAAAHRLNGKRYFVGDRFSAADLAFACMIAPALLPSPEEGYGAVLPALAELPSDLRPIVDELRDTPAGQFALRIFRDHRRP
jgi:glutathione S-transferase